MHDQWIPSLNHLIDWIKIFLCEQGTRSTVHKKTNGAKIHAQLLMCTVFTKYSLDKTFGLVKSFTLFGFPGN